MGSFFSTSGSSPPQRRHDDTVGHAPRSEEQEGISPRFQKSSSRHSPRCWPRPSSTTSGSTLISKIQSSRPRPSIRWPLWSEPNAGAGVAGDAPRIWSQTQDKRVLPAARIASRWRARVSEPVGGRTTRK
jgi:hypothetical protein